MAGLCNFIKIPHRCLRKVVAPVTICTKNIINSSRSDSYMFWWWNIKWNSKENYSVFCLKCSTSVEELMLTHNNLSCDGHFFRINYELKSVQSSSKADGAPKSGGRQNRSLWNEEIFVLHISQWRSLHKEHFFFLFHTQFSFPQVRRLFNYAIGWHFQGTLALKNQKRFKLPG